MRKLGVTAAIGVLVVPTLACAASFALAGGGLGAGTAPVTPCDGGFTVSYTTSGGKLTTITVGDVADPACEGGQLSVTAVDSSGAAVASGGPVTIPSDGDTSPNSVAVPVAGGAAAEVIASTRLVVTGP